MEVKRERWVYMGMRAVGKDHKLYHIWWSIPGSVRISWNKQESSLEPIPEELFGDNAHWFTKNLNVGATVGNVYEFDVEYDGKKVYIGGENRQYLGNWPINNQWMEWVSLTNAAKETRTAHNRKYRVMHTNPVYDALEPIRDAFKKASPPMRRQILAYVIERITR